MSLAKSARDPGIGRASDVRGFRVPGRRDLEPQQTPQQTVDFEGTSLVADSKRTIEGRARHAKATRETSAKR